MKYTKNSPAIQGGKAKTNNARLASSIKQIWVDADACPNVIKQILFRAAERVGVALNLVSKGCPALNPRGELYTVENIRQRLNMRDFMDTMRGSGIDTGGPAPLGQAAKKAFANQLDRLLAK